MVEKQNDTLEYLLGHINIWATEPTDEALHCSLVYFMLLKHQLKIQTQCLIFHASKINKEHPRLSLPYQNQNQPFHFEIIKEFPR